jgi:hypothetical protein
MCPPASSFTIPLLLVMLPQLSFFLALSYTTLDGGSAAHDGHAQADDGHLYSLSYEQTSAAPPQRLAPALPVYEQSWPTFAPPPAMPATPVLPAYQRSFPAYEPSTAYRVLPTVPAYGPPPALPTAYSLPSARPAYRAPPAPSCGYGRYERDEYEHFQGYSIS